jgi:NarL family two-component system response regulator LiaR
VRFCKLVGPVILIVDFESLQQLESEQVPAVEYLSTVEVLALSRSTDDDVYRVALLAGCSGVFPADTPPERLRDVITAIQKGDLWYPRNVVAALARQWMLDQSISRKKLTEREEEILRLLGMDKKNQAIADELFISRETVRWHLRTLYAKIGANNRSEARQYALKHQQNIGAR